MFLWAFLLLLSLLPTCNPTSLKYLHMDFVLLFHHDAQPIVGMPQSSFSFPRAYKSVFLSDWFLRTYPLGDRKTRVSIVGHNSTGEWDVLLPLTSNKTEWERVLTTEIQINGTRQYPLAYGLKTARERVFKDQNSSTVNVRPRVVLVSSFSENSAEYFFSDTFEVGKLTALGVLVLATFRHHTSPSSTAWLIDRMHSAFGKDFVDHTHRASLEFLFLFRFNVPNLIKSKTYERYCYFRTRCFFDERSECLTMEYAPGVPLEYGDCGRAPEKFDKPPTVGQRCESIDECVQTCDQLWRWTIDCNNETMCGETNAAKRRSAYRWRHLRNCPMERKCPECIPETHNSSMSSTVEATKESTASKEEKITTVKKMI